LKVAEKYFVTCTETRDSPIECFQTSWYWISDRHPSLWGRRWSWI